MNGRCYLLGYLLGLPAGVTCWGYLLGYLLGNLLGNLPLAPTQHQPRQPKAGKEAQDWKYALHLQQYGVDASRRLFHVRGHSSA